LKDFINFFRRKEMSLLSILNPMTLINKGIDAVSELDSDKVLEFLESNAK